MAKKVQNNLLNDLPLAVALEPEEKSELERAIAEKEKLLVAILEKAEQLKIDLSVLKQEYDIKIGRLYLRLKALALGARDREFKSRHPDQVRH